LKKVKKKMFYLSNDSIKIIFPPLEPSH
jgi:hypothetical protein